jgi:hypothetical protein
MTEYGFTEADVDGVVSDPSRGTYAPLNRDRIEHFGYARDGGF